MVGMNIGLFELMGWRHKAVAKWQSGKVADWQSGKVANECKISRLETTFFDTWLI